MTTLQTYRQRRYRTIKVFADEPSGVLPHFEGQITLEGKQVLGV